MPRDVEPEIGRRLDGSRGGGFEPSRIRPADRFRGERSGEPIDQSPAIGLLIWFAADISTARLVSGLDVVESRTSSAYAAGRERRWAAFRAHRSDSTWCCVYADRNLPAPQEDAEPDEPERERDRRPERDASERQLASRAHLCVRRRNGSGYLCHPCADGAFFLTTLRRSASVVLIRCRGRRPRDRRLAGDDPLHGLNRFVSARRCVTQRPNETKVPSIITVSAPAKATREYRRTRRFEAWQTDPVTFATNSSLAPPSPLESPLDLHRPLFHDLPMFSPLLDV